MKRKSLKSISCVILVIALLVAMIPVNVYAADSGNNLEVNQEYRISNLNADYISGYSFNLNVPAKGRIRVRIEGCNTIIYDFLYIGNDDGSRAPRKWNVAGDCLDSGWISVTAGQKDMKLGVEEMGLYAENETLYIEFEPAASSNNASEIEDNDTFSTANKINLGKEYEGNFSNKDASTNLYNDIDYYVAEVDTNGLLTVNLTNLTNPEYVIPFQVYREEMNGNYEEILTVVDENYLNLTFEKNLAKTQYRLRVPSGRYYVKIEANWKESSEYKLKLDFREESPLSYEVESNNASKTANRKEFDRKYTGNLHSAKDVDWYTFKAPAEGYVTLEFWTSENVAKDNVLLTLYDETLNTVQTKKTTADKYCKTTKKLVPAGVIYVRVQNTGNGLGDEYDYKLRTVFRCKEHVYNAETVNKPTYEKSGLKKYTCEVCNYEKDEILPALKLKKVSQNAVKKYSSSKVKVSWKDVKDEDGYQIYKMTKKNGSYTIMGKYTTAKTSINVSAKKGVTYYYKVRAYKKTASGTVYGSWSAVKSYKL